MIIYMRVCGFGRKKGIYKEGMGQWQREKVRVVLNSNCIIDGYNLDDFWGHLKTLFLNRAKGNQLRVFFFVVQKLQYKFFSLSTLSCVV